MDGRKYLLGVFAVMALSAVYQYLNRVPRKRLLNQSLSCRQSSLSRSRQDRRRSRPDRSVVASPPGTPRERLFGDHPGETIVPAGRRNSGSSLPEAVLRPVVSVVEPAPPSVRRSGTVRLSETRRRHRGRDSSREAGRRAVLSVRCDGEPGKPKTGVTR